MKKSSRTMIGVRLDDEAARALEAITAQRGCTTTEAIKAVLREAASGGVVDLEGRLTTIDLALASLTADLAIVKRDVAPTVKSGAVAPLKTSSGQPVTVEGPPDAYANWLKNSRNVPGTKPA